MNLYIQNTVETPKPPIKYTVKSTKTKRKSSVGTDKPWRTKEEFAKSIINTLDWSQKYLKGEVKLYKTKTFDEELEELIKIAEDTKNGKY